HTSSKRVWSSDVCSSDLEDYPGVGYLFAVASADPFVYEGIQSRDHWDYRLIADGRVRGDPYVALTDLAQRIVPDGYSDWDYDIKFGRASCRERARDAVWA